MSVPCFAIGGVKPPPPMLSGPNKMDLWVFRLKPHLEKILGSVRFSIIPSLALEMKDCPRVHSTVGRKTVLQRVFAESRLTGHLQMLVETVDALVSVVLN